MAAAPSLKGASTAPAQAPEKRTRKRKAPSPTISDHESSVEPELIIADSSSKYTAEPAPKSAPSSKPYTEEPGTLYVGRIPHGFYEPQMRAYFSQFGTITNLRLSRNKQSGASKHYAFIQFSSTAVAQIVADTMDNYLLFGHILKVKLLPKEQVHEEIWKGANKRFKVIPRRKMEGESLKKRKTGEEWEKRIVKEETKRKRKAEALKEIGYEFDMPDMKSVEEVVLELGQNDTTVEAKAVAPIEEPIPKKAKKGKKVAEIEPEVEKKNTRSKSAAAKSAPASSLDPKVKKAKKVKR
jgi:nucleolar protein 15